MQRTTKGVAALIHVGKSTPPTLKDGFRDADSPWYLSFSFRSSLVAEHISTLMGLLDFLEVKKKKSLLAHDG